MKLDAKKKILKNYIFRENYAKKHEETQNCKLLKYASYRLGVKTKKVSQ